MGSDTRPSRRVKDDENSNSKGKRSGDRGLSAASISAATSDSSGLRRSSRETLTKKVTAQTSPSVSVRKSERLEKKSPKTPSERVEKKCTPSPLLKKCDQNSGSSPKKQKKRKMEKSVKELTSETEEVGRSERRDSELKRNRLDGRSYKAMFFKKQLNKVKASDDSEKHARENMFSQGDSNNCRGDGINKCVERRLGELGDDGGTTENADDELEIIPENCSEVEKAKEPELVDSPFSGRITDGRGLKSDHDVIPTNRKRIRLDDADFEYSKLRCLKRLFLYRTGKLKVADSPRAPILSLSDSPEDYMNGIHSPSSMSGLALGTKLEQNDISRSIKTIQKKFHKKLNKLTQKQREEKNELVRSFEADKARIEEKKKMQIVVIRSCLENNTSMRVDKLKSVEISFAKEFEELEQQMDTRLKKLELEHLAARRKIQDRETQCIDAVKSLVALDELSGNRPSSEPNDNTGDVTLRFPQTNSSNDGANNIAHENVNPPSSEEQICNGLTVNVLEKEIQLRVPEMIGCSEVPLVVSETIGSGDGLENLVSGDGPSSEEQIPNTTAVNVPVNEMQPRVPESVGLGDGDTIGSVTQMSLAEQNQDTVNVLEEVQLRVPETIGCSELAEQNQDTVNMTEKEVQLRVPEAIGCSEIQLRVPEAIGCSEIQLRVPEAIGCSEVQLGVPAMIGSGDGQQNLVSEDGHLSEDQIPATTAVNVPINQMQPRVPKNVSSGDGDTIGSVIEPSLAEQNQDKVNVSKKEVQLRVPETIGCSEVPLGVLETIGSGDSLENLVSGDGTLSEEQIPFTTAVSDPINKMQPRVPENVSSGDGDSVGSVTQMSLAEQIPDTATLNVPGGENTLVPEASCDAVEVSQTSIENNETQTVASNKITGMNQQDIVDNAFDQNSPLQELSLGNLPSVHPAIAMIYGDLMSANQACKDEYTLPSISCGMQLGDVPPRDEQNATEVMQLSLGNSPSVHPAIAMIDGDPMSVNQARGDECTLPSISCAMQLGDVPPCDEQNATAVVCSVSQTVEPALSYQSDHEAMVSEPAVQVHLSPPSNSPRSFNAAAVPFVGEVANLPSSEGCTFNPATELVMNPPLVLNQYVLQPSTSSSNLPIGASGMHFPNLRTSVAFEFNNRPAEVVPAMPWLPAPQHQDSLKKELERLCKEFDQTCKGFEDKKLHLKAEGDKEIAQILLKYELKQREVDAEIFSKKKEFDDIRNKVVMNKMLAEAFMFTWMEFMPSGIPGTQQDINVGYMQQPIQLSMQQSAQRPLLAARMSAASTAAASLQTLPPEPQTTVPASVINPHSIPPPVQGASAMSALFPSAIARPPQMSSLSYSYGNPLGGAEIRARPPHLRGSAPTTSLPPRPHRMSTLPPTNASATQSNALPVPCFPLPLPSSTNQSGCCDGTLRPETSRGSHALPNILSAPELVRNVVRPPAASPSLTDWLSNTGQLNTSDFMASSASVNPVGTSAPTEVVYLSDDD